MPGAKTFRSCAPLLVTVGLLAAQGLPRGVVAADEKPSEQGAAPCVINYIGHEVDVERTRVIIRATKPIDYRGGRLFGDQVILDIAEVEVSLPSPVVELGSPEVDRVILGPELTKDGLRLLKLRLTGVKARRHKVTVKGNELYIDLTPRDNSPERKKGLPKIIRNDVEIVT